MENTNDGTKLLINNKKKEILLDSPGYPRYPASEDIYSQSIEEQDIDPEDISAMKSPNDKSRIGKNNEKDF